MVYRPSMMGGPAMGVRPQAGQPGRGGRVPMGPSRYAAPPPEGPQEQSGQNPPGGPPSKYGAATIGQTPSGRDPMRSVGNNEGSAGQHVPVGTPGIDFPPAQSQLSFDMSPPAGGGMVGGNMAVGGNVTADGAGPGGPRGIANELSAARAGWRPPASGSGPTPAPPGIMPPGGGFGWQPGADAAGGAGFGGGAQNEGGGPAGTYGGGNQGGVMTGGQPGGPTMGGPPPDRTSGMDPRQAMFAKGGDRGNPGGPAGGMNPTAGWSQEQKDDFIRKMRARPPMSEFRPDVAYQSSGGRGGLSDGRGGRMSL